MCSWCGKALVKFVAVSKVLLFLSASILVVCGAKSGYRSTRCFPTFSASRAPEGVSSSSLSSRMGDCHWLMNARGPDQPSLCLSSLKRNGLMYSSYSSSFWRPSVSRLVSRFEPRTYCIDGSVPHDVGRCCDIAPNRRRVLKSESNCVEVW
jgi:hypothetical protein